MAYETEEGTYICDCGEVWENHHQLVGHASHCEEYTTFGRIEKKCPECGTTFETQRKGGRKTCSMECNAERMSNKVTAECDNCGEEFQRCPSHIDLDGDVYCSKECYSDSGRVEKNCELCGDPFEVYKSLSDELVHCEEHRGGEDKKIQRKCKICGDTFHKYESEISKGWGKYCSDECYGVAKRNKVEVKCEECGRVFEDIPSKVEKNENTFCDKECWKSYMTGETHPNWAGERIEKRCEECGEVFEHSPWEELKYCSTRCSGKSQRLPEHLRRETNYGPMWPEQRQTCLERDGWECQRCGITQEECKEEYNQELHVHHITPYRLFDDNEEAHRLDNLVALCPSCHVKEEPTPVDTQSVGEQKTETADAEAATGAA